MRAGGKMDSDYIGKRITQLRMQKNVSEYQMSLELGQSKGYIQGITSGRSLPSMAQFLNICDYFEISPMEFFSENIEDPCMLRSEMEKLNKLDKGDIEILHIIIERFYKTREV